MFRVALVSFVLAIAAPASVLGQEAAPVPQDPGLRVLPEDPGWRNAQAPAPAPAPEPPQTLQPPTQPPQTLKPPTQPPSGDKPQPGRQGAAPPAPPAPEPPRKIRGKDVNVHIELTISDQIGSTPPEKKVVSLLAADQTMGRVRANARTNAPVGFVGTGLNVDARPTVLEGDRILVELTLEYTPLREGAKTQEPTNLHESLSVLLQSGKPMVISQAADPISDRKMVVEVKATVLK